MKTYQLPYGKSCQPFTTDERNQWDLILPNPVKAAENPGAIISSSLANPIALDFQRLHAAKSVCIAVNDKTRPVPHDDILPPLLDWLHQMGVSISSIKFWIATGSLSPIKPEEYGLILPQLVIDNYSIESHDINQLDNLVWLGTTSRGTPVIVNRRFYEADFKIVVGDIEPHHFAGFSGGSKSAAIGLAGRETINHNHAMLTDPNSWIGVYETNPLRQDINEIGRLIGIDMALNTILNTEKRVVAAVAGSPDAVMQIGIPIAREVCGTPIDKSYDLVIASAGGHPKDINFYQAQKALTHASLFCKSGGTLILIAACPEGSGSAAYEEFMQGVSTINAVFEKFGQMEFRVGPHKAFQVARLLSRFRIILVSQIHPQTVRALLMEPSTTVQQAYSQAIASGNETHTVAIVPHATTTLPA
jgi:nickel-dependent lactate racemase